MKKNNKKGFTLVELVIVVAVMAVLVAVAIPTIGSISKTAKENVQATNARTIESVLKLAEAEASKDGDGVTTIDEQDTLDALAAAKLGIDEGIYHYDVEAGTVEYVATAGTGDANNFYITFDDSEPVIKVVGDQTVQEVSAPATT